MTTSLEASIPIGGYVSQRSAEITQPAAYADGFNHQPLRTVVANALRDAILDGSLMPGDSLVEKTIAEELEISRAPVREAIRMLAEEGLVESVPYKGSRVRSLSRRDVREVYAIRGLLERFALELVLKEGPADMSELEAACMEMERAATVGDARALNEADERLHRSLIEMADHELLVTLWSQIELRARQILALRNDQIGDLTTVAVNHRSIVTAIAAGDADRAKQLIEEHVASGTELVLIEGAETA